MRSSQTIEIEESCRSRYWNSNHSKRGQAIMGGLGWSKGSRCAPEPRCSGSAPASPT